eukprot:Gb_16874 [translate_table: standard]
MQMSVIACAMKLVHKPEGAKRVYFVVQVCRFEISLKRNVSHHCRVKTEGQQGWGYQLRQQQDPYTDCPTVLLVTTVPMMKVQTAISLATTFSVAESYAAITPSFVPPIQSSSLLGEDSQIQEKA